ncbi:MAG: Uma2 family endonuclease [Microscillaceae bacterium]|jgi:Uma2 family endonuclease|nr:Uma2 family endonuclease [Microscillaceae bacterium]
MIANKVLSIEDFNLFQERMRDFALFEFIDKQIVPVQGTEPVEISLVEYVLSSAFDENEIKITFPMATQKHDKIISNLHGYLFFICKKLGLIVYSQGTDVYVPEADKGYKPDVVLVKKDVEKRENHHILNPLATFEVLSKSTQAKDKTEKLDGYQSIASLQAYILISQDECKVTVYQRINENTWQSQILTKMSDTFSLNHLDLVMNLKEIYEEIEF